LKHTFGKIKAVQGLRRMEDTKIKNNIVRHEREK